MSIASLAIPLSFVPIIINLLDNKV